MLSSLKSIFETKPNELNALNAFRTFSVLGILVHHYWEAVRPSFLGTSVMVDFLDRVPLNLLSVMDLFLMLSGFLISGGLWLDWKKNGTIHFGKYFTRRSFRIFPLFYAALLVSFALTNAQIQLMSKQTLDAAGTSMLAELKQMKSHWWTDALFISNYTSHKIMIHGWSLAVEQQFYTFLPLIAYFFLFRLSNKTRILSLCVLYFVPLVFRIIAAMNIDSEFGQMSKIYWPTHTRADSLILGILIMDLYYTSNWFRGKIADPMLRRIGFVLSLVLLGIGHALTFAESQFVFCVFRYNFFNIGYAILICLSLHSVSSFSKILSARVFTPIARVSYGMYMWQGIAGSAGMALVLKGLDLHQLTAAQALAGFISGTLFTFLAGIISWVIIESPFMRLRTRLAGPSPDLKNA
ncbi:MAG TPA: acyltransferase [Leptospiraceae bacterium]|nr:acyltransferase [Leptospiraceae bacterium]HQI18181.1 acyltransferase [Leptospiraceae bacterium]